MKILNKNENLMVSGIARSEVMFLKLNKTKKENAKI
jgi:hypothetical protein